MALSLYHYSGYTIRMNTKFIAEQDQLVDEDDTVQTCPAESDANRDFSNRNFLKIAIFQLKSQQPSGPLKMYQTFKFVAFVFESPSRLFTVNVLQQRIQVRQGCAIAQYLFWVITSETSGFRCDWVKVIRPRCVEKTDGTYVTQNLWWCWGLYCRQKEIWSTSIVAGE